MNYNIIALKDSLYSSQFYRRTAAMRSDNGFGFLAIIALIQTIVLSVTIAAAMLMISKADIDGFINQTPEVTLQNGQLSIDQPSPYRITAGDTPIIIIDTENYNEKSAEFIFNEMREKKLAALVTKTKIYTRKDNNNEYRVYDLSEDSSKEIIKFNKDDVRKWAKMASIILLPLAAIFIFFGVWVYKIIQMLIYSVVGLIINSMLKRNLTYSTIQRLTSYCLWPPTLFITLIGFANFEVMTLISIIITIGYIYFAVKSAETRIVPLAA